MTTYDNMLAIWRRWRQHAHDLYGCRVHIFAVLNGQRLVNYHFLFQSGRQSILFCQTRWKISPVVIVPVVQLIAIVLGIGVSVVTTASIMVAITIVVLIVSFSMPFSLSKSHAAGQGKYRRGENGNPGLCLPVFAPIVLRSSVSFLQRLGVGLILGRRLIQERNQFTSGLWDADFAFTNDFLGI